MNTIGGAVDHPITIPSDHYVTRAVIDADTCPTCRDADGVSVVVLRGETPTMHECEHVRDPNDDRECRCVFERVTSPTRIQDGLVPLGPLDTYNGVKISALCMDCRNAIARYEHRMVQNIVLCEACSKKIQAGTNPGPWKWWAHDGLLDANGVCVAWPASPSPTAPDHPSERAKVLLELAPNLERLREIEWSATNFDEHVCPACYVREESGRHAGDCWLGNTIARLDAAKAGQ